jgi:hypothetical protein
MTSGNRNQSKFPNPLAPQEEKATDDYGLRYAKAIEGQWGSADDVSSVVGGRQRDFERNRDYANGTQDTSIYKQILNSLDPNNGDGTLLNLDWSPVPIVPKFVKVVVNKVLSRKPYPSVEAIDPVSKGEKDEKKALIESSIENKSILQEARTIGLKTELDPSELPDSTEEAEIFMEQNIKTNAEIAAQIGTSLTLDWNDFDDGVYRRCVEDLVVCGMGVAKRSNDPNYGITIEYVDPAKFVHSYTEDPNMSDIVYGGHIRHVSIGELKRLAGDSFTEKEYEEIANKAKSKSFNDSSNFSSRTFDKVSGSMRYGYDDYLIEILDFEFVSVDCVYYESKESRFGNVGFYYKGFDYKTPTESVYNREPFKMEVETVYGGSYLIGANKIFNYGVKKNVPKNVHDLTKARLSYSVACTNLRRMRPKSMVGSIIGFADQLQLTHLKIQQAIAKAKPDGVIVDIEGLENVQLGRGGELQPLQIQDIYEQTGVFYYRSKNPDGTGQQPPIRPIDNTIRNIQQYVMLYNHYLTMIRDASGVNEVMDASTPKGDALVGVRQQALAAGNNALYDITNASLVLYKRVCQDVVKCLQIIPTDSVLYRVYEKAIGKYNMETLSSFQDLPMYNFGVRVVKEMSDEDRVFLEQNIQQSLAQKEIDLEDALAVRQIKDIDQAQRLLVVRRKRRMAAASKAQQQNMQMQQQMNAQNQQMAMQMRSQQIQMEAQVEAQKIQLKGQTEIQVAQALHSLRREIEMIRAQATVGMRSTEQEFREKIDILKEDRKDSRVDKQAAAQSKLIAQRKGERPVMDEAPDAQDDIISQILNNG